VPTLDEQISYLKVEMRELDRSLERWADRSMPAYKRTLQMRKEKQANYDRLLQLVMEGERPSMSGRGSSRTKKRLPRRGQYADPDVARRRKLVGSSPGLSTLEICRLLDRKTVPLPHRWQNAGLKSWASTYQRVDYRRRVHVVISKDRGH
jgi:hypothetical protein